MTDQSPLSPVPEAAQGLAMYRLDLMPPDLAEAFDAGFGRTYNGAQGWAPRQHRHPAAQAAFEAGWKLGRAVHENRGEKVLQARKQAAIAGELPVT